MLDREHFWTGFEKRAGLRAPLSKTASSRKKVVDFYLDRAKDLPAAKHKAKAFLKGLLLGGGAVALTRGMQEFDSKHPDYRQVQ